MPSLAVEITRYVDDHFPGWVECVLLDADGTRHTFVDKVPVVTLANLQSDSDYPQPGSVRCEVEAQWIDDDGRCLVRVSTGRPDGVESSDGASIFVVLAGQVDMAEAI